VCYVILGFVGHVVGIVRRHYWEASSSTIQNHSTTRTTHSFLYIDLTQPQVTSRLVHDPYSGLSPLSHPSHCLYSGRPASMSSIPDILSGVDLIPHLDSPASMTPSPRPGSPTQPGLGLGPGPHRSKTAPPPGPPPPPDFPSPVHAPLMSSDRCTRGQYRLYFRFHLHVHARVRFPTTSLPKAQSLCSPTELFLPLLVLQSGHGRFKGEETTPVHTSTSWRAGELECCAE
jgi:hypothetical protein